MTDLESAIIDAAALIARDRTVPDVAYMNPKTYAYYAPRFGWPTLAELGFVDLAARRAKTKQMARASRWPFDNGAAR